MYCYFCVFLQWVPICYIKTVVMPLLLAQMQDFKMLPVGTKTCWPESSQSELPLCVDLTVRTCMKVTASAMSHSEGCTETWTMMKPTFCCPALSNKTTSPMATFSCALTLAFLADMKTKSFPNMSCNAFSIFFWLHGTI